MNVSRFGPRLAGAGGFINISQNARAVVFAGTFTAVGLEVAISDGAIEIQREGRVGKFLDRVEQVTFSGARAARLGQPVLYVTERCVFELTAEGLELVEIAPGIDIDRDIVEQMQVRPIVRDLRQMDARIFAPAAMDLRTDLLHLDLKDRIAIDKSARRLFLNFEKLRLRSVEEVERVGALVAQACEPLGARVDVIVNYDGFRIDEALEARWAEMVAHLTERYYARVSRYSGSAFMRMKLRDVFHADRTHIFESADQARAFLNARES